MLSNPGQILLQRVSGKFLKIREREARKNVKSKLQIGITSSMANSAT